MPVEQRRVGYELDQELPRTQAPAPDRLGVTSDITREGGQAGTVLLRPDDPQYRGELGFRSEWQSDFYADIGGEYAYAASYFFPADWYQGRNQRTFDDRIIFQFHEGNGESPVFSLHLDAGSDQIRVRQRRVDGVFVNLWQTPIVPERWYDVAFRVRWSRGGDGIFQIYLDGKLRHEYRGRTLTDASRVYTKWGIYGQPTRLVVDEVRIVQGEGIEGVMLATPARVATLLEIIPSTGFGLVRFTGGSTGDLVDASNCAQSARFWFAHQGKLIALIAGSPEFVNREWYDRFKGDLPKDTLLLAACGR